MANKELRSKAFGEWQLLNPRFQYTHSSRKDLDIERMIFLYHRYQARLDAARKDAEKDANVVPIVRRRDDASRT